VLLTGVGILLGLCLPLVAFVAGMGFVLTSTAIVMQILGSAANWRHRGQKMVSILLLEDLAIVPLLAVVALLAPAAEGRRMLARACRFGIAHRRYPRCSSCWGSG
jgi:glutathione-regulated potassium-efflux system protein KefB